MAKYFLASRYLPMGLRRKLPAGAAGAAILAMAVSAQVRDALAGQNPLIRPAVPQLAWKAAVRSEGRMVAAQLGLVINRADPYSVAVGRQYAVLRHLRPEQVLSVDVPVKSRLTPSEFLALKDRIDAHFNGDIQGIVFAWMRPYAVNCNSITGALALGYDDALCSNPCSPSRVSPYFNSPTARPFTELRLRPSMLLAAPDVAAATALIQRGVASDFSLGLRGAVPVNAHYLITRDKARSSRAVLFPPPGRLLGVGVDVHVEAAQALDNAERVLIYLTGLPHVAGLDKVKWVPGALADHLTSAGGQLDGAGGQMSAVAWISSGATASYGTVSEPCSYPQKFSHPQLLLQHYVQGSTALEAYWKSVAWPQQGVFIGEPLAAPFARRAVP
jgi:uncharacterized protein (TIGR03790 family)